MSDEKTVTPETAATTTPEGTTTPETVTPETPTQEAKNSPAEDESISEALDPSLQQEGESDHEYLTRLNSVPAKTTTEINKEKEEKRISEMKGYKQKTPIEPSPVSPSEQSAGKTFDEMEEQKNNTQKL